VARYHHNIPQKDAFVKRVKRRFFANPCPEPSVWTAIVESIPEKLARCRQTLEQIQPGCTSPKTRKRRKVAVQLFRGHYT
jgi:hypothetical protein